MDNTKIYAILKKALHIQIAADPDGGQWIGDANALYNVDGLPRLNADNILPMIGVDIDTKAKYTVAETELPYADEIMKSAAEGDGLVELTDLNLRSVSVMRGVGQNAPLSVFINAVYLKPFISDDEISYIIRRVKNDAGYIIIVKRGLITLAIIAPVAFKSLQGTAAEMITDLTNVIKTIKQQISGSDDAETQMMLAVDDD